MVLLVLYAFYIPKYIAYCAVTDILSIHGIFSNIPACWVYPQWPKILEEVREPDRMARPHVTYTFAESKVGHMCYNENSFYGNADREPSVALWGTLAGGKRHTDAWLRCSDFIPWNSWANQLKRWVRSSQIWVIVCLKYERSQRTWSQRDKATAQQRNSPTVYSLRTRWMRTNRQSTYGYLRRAQHSVIENWSFGRSAPSSRHLCTTRECRRLFFFSRRWYLMLPGVPIFRKLCGTTRAVRGRERITVSCKRHSPRVCSRTRSDWPR